MPATHGTHPNSRRLLCRYACAIAKRRAALSSLNTCLCPPVTQQARVSRRFCFSRPTLPVSPSRSTLPSISPLEAAASPMHVAARRPCSGAHGKVAVVSLPGSHFPTPMTATPIAAATRRNREARAAAFPAGWLPYANLHPTKRGLPRRFSSFANAHPGTPSVIRVRPKREFCSAVSAVRAGGQTVYPAQVPVAPGAGRARRSSPLRGAIAKRAPQL